MITLPLITITEMNQLEMLSAREQLMEDIDCIISGYFQGIDEDELNEVTRILCDAVCQNFPSDKNA
jgi:hypothetical protein